MKLRGDSGFKDLDFIDCADDMSIIFKNLGTSRKKSIKPRGEQSHGLNLHRVRNPAFPEAQSSYGPPNAQWNFSAGDTALLGAQSRPPSLSPKAKGFGGSMFPCAGVGLGFRV